MTISISGTGGVTFPDNSVQATAATGFGFKNRIINGQMVIDQRNAGASVTQVNSSNVFAVDRWFGIGGTGAGKFTMQRNAGSVTPPAGYTNYLGVTSTSAFSVPSGDLYLLGQAIEGFNVADLGWGTASAQAITVSFWVRSSLTGAFGGSVGNAGWISNTRSYPFSFTISAANTWEQKTVTIAGDTTGTWTTSNATGLTLSFGLGIGTSSSGTAGAWVTGNILAPTGATSVVGTSGATFYITGVQLEKGSTATAFDYRPYGTELALCQRYGLRVEQQQNTGGISSTSTTTNVRFTFPVVMRSAPTASFTTAGSWIVGNDYNANYTASSVSILAQQLTVNGGRVNISGFPSFGSNFFVAGTDAVGTAVMFMGAEL